MKTTLENAKALWLYDGILAEGYTLADVCGDEHFKRVVSSGGNDVCFNCGGTE